ncbi:hypothetical protein C9374_012106 [Naegleria lovaniensis]|uniref:Uncharacterized protein n=1 Tax=Naegleria lovaniensis TaxID=51637 RepID=A0AA88GF82_NAELO|nr:uncharacterized protein C9374_012106 [Naegleria lovaniensis]KAG2373499.1 hypothetical protein C9374_012106 [Naegleria lovaniensis]
MNFNFSSSGSSSSGGSFNLPSSSSNTNPQIPSSQPTPPGIRSSNVGHDDVHPQINPPIHIPSSISDEGSSGSSGSQVGPHDPMFSGTHRPSEQHPHFDPVYPHNPMGDPIPDHQRVPHDLGNEDNMMEGHHEQ